MSARLPAIALACLLLLPLATAQGSQTAMTMGGGITFTGSGDPFTQMTIDLSVSVSGQSAKDFRQAMDSEFLGGDGDGRVEETEVAAFKAMMEGMMGGSVGEMGDNMTIDAKGPTGANMTSLEVEGATGSTESALPITIRISGNADFPVAAAATHTLQVQGGDEEEESMEGMEFTGLTVKAPAGWTITARTGVFQDATLSGDERTLTFQDMPTAGEAGTVVFKKAGSGGGKGLPGAGVGLIVAVLSVAVALRRRD